VLCSPRTLPASEVHISTSGHRVSALESGILGWGSKDRYPAIWKTPERQKSPRRRPCDCPSPPARYCNSRPDKNPSCRAPRLMARRSRPKSAASGHSASTRFAACGVSRFAQLRRQASPRISSPGFFAGTSRSRRLAGLIRKPPTISPASDGAIGHQQITQGASSPEPSLCANTRASGIRSRSLRMALSGARPPMPASPPSPEPSPVRTGMDRASSASGSTRRRQYRRTPPIRRLDSPMEALFPRRHQLSASFLFMRRSTTHSMFNGT
jgi:hypothetical protein